MIVSMFRSPSPVTRLSLFLGREENKLEHGVLSFITTILLLFKHEVVQSWLPRDAVEIPSLEMPKNQWDTALSNLL